MNKKFIERHIHRIKELLIVNDYVSKDWQPGEIISNDKFGGFKNDYLKVSFYSKWVWTNEYGSKNCNNIGGRMVYWSYDKQDLYWFDVEYVINASKVISSK